LRTIDIPEGGTGSSDVTCGLSGIVLGSSRADGVARGNPSALVLLIPS
jgi:hypothetical protein